MENTYVSTTEPVGNDKIFAVLSYLGLWVIAVLSNPEKEHEFVRNHIKNGIILTVLAMIGAVVPFLGWAFDIAVLVFAIIGIIKVVKGEMYELPLVGGMFPTLNLTKVVSVMCYVSCGWVYALICYPEKEDLAVKSHINNGLLISLAAAICALIPVLGWICDIVLLVFAIIGIVKACKGEVYNLPILGKIQIVK